MRRMLKHKGLAVFMATFAVVLLSGVALAQVGMMSLGGDDTEGEAASMVAPPSGSYDFVGDDIDPGEDLNPEPKPQPKDEPAEEPKDHKPEAPVEDEIPHEKPTEDGPKDEAPEAVEEPETADGADDPQEVPPADVDDSVLLEITSPSNGAHVEREVITFKGVTDPDAVVTYGRYEARMDDEGHWSIALVLRAGKNIMPFRAEDEAGNVAEAAVTVYLDVPEEKHEFSAHQKWEASDDDPPANLYWGTATPGTGIWIASEYGTAHTEANGDGVWEARVIFEGAPHAEKFKVVVESGNGGRAQFFMKVFYPAHEETHNFTAHQKYGSCGEEIPYDVFWGTATPGAEIWVESEYGGGVTHANDDGVWEIRVEFPEAPHGEVFGVIVESSDGGVEDFTFVATGESHEA
ncbi:MAG: hypothetical protein ACE5GC_08355 [Acidimicrobiia bacterium]